MQAIFGEGWTWAGALLLHLLGLRHRFEALNFTTFLYHVQHLFPPVPQTAEEKREKVAVRTFTRQKNT